jgi:hypothetical protein
MSRYPLGVHAIFGVYLIGKLAFIVLVIWALIKMVTG